jgi:molybdopterin-containing oxidoreductase family iron-sulfur binding subunit
MKSCPSKPHDERPIEPVAVREGRRHWRAIEELASSAELEELLEREFPEQHELWRDPVTRRQFLTLMGASLAFAGLAGCAPQAPVGEILPYARQPEQIVLGKPLQFATTFTLAGWATGILVKSHEGRPTKVEGNPDHPASLGATDAFMQAAILDLYDPDRSQAITYRDEPRSWSEAQLVLRKALAELRKNQGSGLAILTETVGSPSLAEQLSGEASALRRDFPNARWCQYEPTWSSGLQEGARLAFGEAVDTVYDFGAADVVVSLASDFMGSGPAHLRYARQFMSRRQEAIQSGSRAMNRLYAFENCPTVTGSAADHRIPSRASDIGQLAIQLAGAVQATTGQQAAAGDDRRIRAIARDLIAHRGAGIVVAGAGQPAVVHAAAHAINEALGNVGRTVRYIKPAQSSPRDQLADLAELTEQMAAGRLSLLLILGGNPAFNAPVNLKFAEALRRVPLRVHLGLHRNETSAACDWHLPQAHFLESWGDGRAFDGTASIQQPLIAPLYNGLSTGELISALFDSAARPGHELVRDYWRRNWPAANSGGDFESGWKRALHDGLVAGTAAEPRSGLKVSQSWSSAVPKSADQAAELEIAFDSDPTVFDGRYVNNGWLQELPKPITKLTWDNALLIGPKLAEHLGITERFGINGGEHGQGITDMVEVEVDGRALRVPAWIVPGHADNSATLHFGYGRTAAGRVGSGAGFNAYAIRTSQGAWFSTGLKIRKLDEQFTLASTQMHHSMQGRDPVQAFTFEQYKQDPAVLQKSWDEHHQEYQHELVPKPQTDNKAASSEENKLTSLTLYPGYDYGPPKNKWGMAIDLTSCVGCNGCVVACQAENNIPVVGKTEVTRGREMHWLRIDRYHEGPKENPVSYFQPVPCMHCENAPCELVCPVGATVHSADGLNDMVYNRCVGTRYCSNNCPYKVRRFNFLAFADFTTESLKLGRNPNVTVRSRGVMEKCTYCVQRIRSAQIQAEIDGKPIRDGDVVTACQAACPTNAIVFGDMNDPNSKVAKMKAQPLNYGVLVELSTRPRTTYLAALRNPNPELVD